MRALSKILIVILLIVLVFSVNQSQAQNQNKGRYIVTLRGPVGNAVQRAGGQVIHQYSIIPAITIEIPNAALPGLARNPNVVGIERDVVMWATVKPETPPGQDKKPPVPNPEPDPEPSQLLPWGVDRIDAEEVWPAGYTGAGVNVAVIDTGIDYKHPDLKNNFGGLKGINIINTRKAPLDDNGHGTHVAGTIAASNNGFGVVGVAPDATLFAVKVLNRLGLGWMSDIIAGIDWCYLSADIDIINMSLGGYPDVYWSSQLKAACDNAYKAGIILVAAAGNEGGDPDIVEPSAPAVYDSVISVGATYQFDSLDYIASFSNPGFDIAAPGVNIESTLPGGLYASYDDGWSGTSMACPHVVGTLALAIQANKILYTFSGDICTNINYNVIFNTDDHIIVYSNSGLIDAAETVLGVEVGND